MYEQVTIAIIVIQSAQKEVYKFQTFVIIYEANCYDKAMVSCNNIVSIYNSNTIKQSINNLTWLDRALLTYQILLHQCHNIFVSIHIHCSLDCSYMN